MAANSGSGFVFIKTGSGPRFVKEQSQPQVSEDVALVNSARNGDRGAFGRLYDRYARMVHGILLAKVPIGDVDDLVQDVFLLALRRLSTLRESGSFGPWLAAIARNRAHDLYRRSMPEDQLADDTPQDISDCESHGNREISATAVLNTIRALPDAYRETLILRLVEGMTGPEIAARTGLTHGSVRVNLCRGTRMLREQLNLWPGRIDSEQEKGSPEKPSTKASTGEG
jgi:RNA polymerase sigma-70 factor (ECF subfamily)